MYGDFSRLIFHPDRPEKHYSSVLLQQGRVQLDSDANEQAAILLHYLRTLATDLIGPYGGPSGDDSGFKIDTVCSDGRLTDLTIGKGRYYVDGILVENDVDVWYSCQPDAYPDCPLPDSPFLVYLQVFERLITAVEDPTIREIALGDNGPDTATRTKVVWQVKAMKLDSPDYLPALSTALQENKEKRVPAYVNESWPCWKKALMPPSGQLKAQAKRPPDAMAGPCVIDPAAGYRGAENQLYRVEIHDGSTAGTATFKWSRDNGSVVFPVIRIEGSEVTVASLGRDATLGLEVGDWVEVVDDRYALGNQPQPLREVKSVEPLKLQVTLDCPPPDTSGQDHPLLRRWDQKSDAVLITHDWFDLEDGIQVQFQCDATATYTRGDFWLIPARTATGDIEGGSERRPPDGISYHLAPLALIDNADPQPPRAFDVRCSFTRLGLPAV